MIAVHQSMRLTLPCPLAHQYMQQGQGGVIDLAEHHKLGGASRKYAEYAHYAVILRTDDITGEYYHATPFGNYQSLPFVFE